MNKSNWQRAQVKAIIGAWAVISGLFALQLLTTEVFRPENFDSFQLISYPSFRFLVGAILILLLVIPSYNAVATKPISIKIPVLIFAGFTFSILLSFCNRLGLRAMAGPLDLNQVWKDTVNEIVVGIYHNVLYFLVLIAILEAHYFLQAKRLATERKEQVERELAETKLIVLRNQLQPHFLFNALHGISSIIDYNKEAAQDMIADLSNLLRNSLQTDFTKPILLEDELVILNAYLNIERKRFEHQIEIEEAIAQSALGRSILPFTLQPLVENSIKHGFLAGSSSLTIKIEAFQENSNLLIRVSNDGQSLSIGKPGIGIQNLKARLASNYGEKAHFTLAQRGEWVVNEIRIKSA